MMKCSKALASLFVGSSMKKCSTVLSSLVPDSGITTLAAHYVYIIYTVKFHHARLTDKSCCLLSSGGAGGEATKEDSGSQGCEALIAAADC